MARRKLVVFYNGDADNVKIADTDYGIFYKDLETKIKDIKDLHVDSYLCRDAVTLLDKLAKLSDPKQEDAEEIYLHFSGHGTTKGIPYGDWILKNKDLVNFLGSPRFKFCFFSSCSAGDLVDLANQKKIPIVLGTRGDSKVENQFAIKFQKRFYEELLEKKNFWEAFNTAGSHARTDLSKEVTIDEPIIRGEMGADDLNSERLNALQIIFSSEEFTEWRMIPRNFIDRISQEGSNKPQVILWTDDPLNEKRIIEKFEKKGLSQRIDLFPMPTAELDLLTKMEDWSPLLNNPHKTLVLHLTKREAIDRRLLTFLDNESIFDQERFKVVSCRGSGIALDDCISNAALVSVMESKSEQFILKNQDAEQCLEQNQFIDFVQKQAIGFGQRKKITFSFETPPVVEQMDQEVPSGNLLRIYIGHARNENLFHFLINRFLDEKNLNYPVLTAENQISDHTELIKELTGQVKKKMGSDKNLTNVLSTGGFMIVKLSGIDGPKRSQVIKDFVQQLKSAWVFGEVSRESYIFFLFDGPDLNFQDAEEKIHVCKFSNPENVSIETITKWKEKFPPSGFIDKIIINKVLEISDAMNPDDFKDCCPSRAIEFVCDKLELPHKQIIGI